MATEFNPQGFDLLLQQLAQAEPEAGGLAAYLRLRRDLTAFLQRSGCDDFEYAADEALFRLTKILAQQNEERIANPKGYGFGIARLVLLEMRRQGMRCEPLPERDEEQFTVNPSVPKADPTDVMLMRRCFLQLPQSEQLLIARYAQCEHGDKQKLAEELGVSAQWLGQQVFKIRTKLRRWMEGLSEFPAATRAWQSA